MDKNQSYPTPEMTQLFKAICQLKSENEAEKFFRDLLTLPELKEFANRWQIVKLLIQRKPYTEIAQKLQVSTATVTRVAHWLHRGMGGYQLIASRILKSR